MGDNTSCDARANTSPPAQGAENAARRCLLEEETPLQKGTSAAHPEKEMRAH